MTITIECACGKRFGKADAGKLLKCPACGAAVSVPDDPLTGLIDKGLLTKANLEGLKQSQIDLLVKEGWSIYWAELRCAKQEEEELARASKQAETARTPMARQYWEKRVKIRTEQAKQARSAARHRTIRFGEQAADMFRKDLGWPAVKRLALEIRPVVERPTASLDDLANRTARMLERFAEKDRLRENFKWLMANRADRALSPDAINGLRQSFRALIGRLERMEKRLGRPIVEPAWTAPEKPLAAIEKAAETATTTND
jgi:hypothetical protein